MDSTDGFLMALMDAGASDETVDRLKGGSALSVAEIKAQWISSKTQLDVNGDGATDSTDGFLVVLVDSGAQDSTIDRLKFSAVRTAQQIKDYVNTTLNKSAPVSASGFLSASADESGAESLDESASAAASPGGRSDGERLHRATHRFVPHFLSRDWKSVFTLRHGFRRLMDTLGVAAVTDQDVG
jgi:hypothetical protein